MKKCISVLLILVMLVGVFALPAAAASVEPRYPSVPCPECAGGTSYEGYWDNAYHYHCDYCNLDFTMKR